LAIIRIRIVRLGYGVLGYDFWMFVDGWHLTGTAFSGVCKIPLSSQLLRKTTGMVTAQMDSLGAVVWTVET